MSVARIGVLLFLLTAWVAVAAPSPVRANGVPVRIILGYLPGVSNWGPTNGTGVVEVATSEGEVNGSVLGLPTLTGEVFHGWLVKTQTGETFPIGSFNTDATGSAKLRFRLPAEIPDRGWNLFLISVEAAGKVPAAPDQRRSLAGYFPIAQSTTEVPQQLPRTGGDIPVGNEAAAPLNIPEPAPSLGLPWNWIGGIGIPVVIGVLGLLAFPVLRRRR